MRERVEGEHTYIVYITQRVLYNYMYVSLRVVHIISSRGSHLHASTSLELFVFALLLDAVRPSALCVTKYNN